jgi:hypothetical protein
MITLTRGKIYRDTKEGTKVEFVYMGQTGLAIVCEPGDSGGEMQSSWGIDPGRIEEILQWNGPKRTAMIPIDSTPPARGADAGRIPAGWIGSTMELACARVWKAKGEENIQSYSKIKDLSNPFTYTAQEGLRLLTSIMGEPPTDFEYVGWTPHGPSLMDFTAKEHNLVRTIEVKMIMEGGTPDSIRPPGGQPTIENFLDRFHHLAPKVRRPRQKEKDYQPRLRLAAKQVILETLDNGSFYKLVKEMHRGITLADYNVLYRRPLKTNHGFGEVYLIENSSTNRRFPWEKCSFSRSHSVKGWGGIATSFFVNDPGREKPIKLCLMEVQPKANRVQFRFILKGLLAVTKPIYKTNDLSSLE